MRQRRRTSGARVIRKSATPSEPQIVEIERLSHEGRGVARINGKTLFVKGALPGETVQAVIDKPHRRYDEGHMTELLTASSERVDPPCPHFQQCGGCQLQHLTPEKQISYKQQSVLEQLQRQAAVEPAQLNSHLSSTDRHYRRSARIGINQRQDGSAITGFRQEGSHRLTPISRCLVLDPRGDEIFEQLETLLNQYPGQIKRITHAELTLGDSNGTLTLRVMKNLDGGLQQRLTQLAENMGCSLHLDHGKQLETVKQTEPASFSLPEFGLTLNFAPGDFIQVNAQVNQAMIGRAMEWLAPTKDERILDLFCGLGNFTLPLATLAGEVVGVEGSKEMVARGQANAELNNLTNCQFEAADLTQSITARRWYKQGFDKALIDPPRTGALEIIQQLVKTPVQTLLYVSCNPAALARDAVELKAAGFRLSRFCVMDMFPHTTHVESLALFTREQT